MPLDKKHLLDLLADGPVIASVKDEEGLAAALESAASVVFLLYGDLLGAGDLTRRAKAAGKAVFLHLDLVDGLAAREVTVDFVARCTAADGILSTKPQLIRRARELGLVAVQRFFLLDSMALRNIEKHLVQDDPDLIEVLPGLMPRVIRQLSDTTGKPIIAGGLIDCKEDVVAALAAGAVAVSVTRSEIWAM
jgi:glycerol uptake operon antiterminator